MIKAISFTMHSQFGKQPITGRSLDESECLSVPQKRDIRAPLFVRDQCPINATLFSPLSHIIFSSGRPSQVHLKSIIRFNLLLHTCTLPAHSLRCSFPLLLFLRLAQSAFLHRQAMQLVRILLFSLFEGRHRLASCQSLSHNYRCCRLSTIPSAVG